MCVCVWKWRDDGLLIWYVKIKVAKDGGNKASFLLNNQFLHIKTNVGYVLTLININNHYRKFVTVQQIHKITATVLIAH